MARPIPDLEPMQASEAAADDVVIIDDTSDSETKKMSIDQLLKLIVPTGLISPFGGPTAPDGFLLCDGAAVSRTEYADLFAVIGDSYGVGDGSSTFNLPDLQGRVPVGLDESQTEFDTLGKSGGHKLMQNHRHRYGAGNQSVPLVNPSSANMFVMNIQDSGSGTYVIGGDMAGATITEPTHTQYEGGGDSENLQPYSVVNHIIKI